MHSPEPRPTDEPSTVGRDATVEWVEWIDDDGHVIDVVTRADMRAKNLAHRSCAVVVRSTDGRLLVHRRADSKDLAPGWWDVCAGGVLGVGEAPLVGARRELTEELGLAVAPEALHLLGTGRFDDARCRESCTVFEVTSDGPFEFADGEVAEARWVDRQELSAMLTQHRFLPTCEALVLPLVAGFEPSPRDRAELQGSCAYHRGVTQIEFTIEPFVEGQPGPHVTEAVDAIEQLGVAVDVGPFGSACSVPPERVGEIVAALTNAAVARGATHVHLDITAKAPDA